MHGLIDTASNAVLRFHDFGAEEPPTLAPAKGLRWLPVADKPTLADGEKLVGPQVVADAIVWTAEAMTADELAAAKEAQKRRYAAAILRHLDQSAQAMDYDSIHTAASYDGDPNPAWAAQGAAAKAWRSAVWTSAYAIMAEVEAGTRAKPTEAELVALLPAISWPA